MECVIEFSQMNCSIDLNVAISCMAMGTVAVGLLIFGTLYDALVGWLERHGYDEGYTAILVVVGVSGTLIGLAFLDWKSALLAFGAFACSGLPMTVGSWWRHVEKRRKSRDDLTQVTQMLAKTLTNLYKKEGEGDDAGARLA